MPLTHSPRVYLAGPITHCGYGEANDWRQVVATKLVPAGIVGVSPLRCEPIRGDVYTPDSPDPRFGTARAIAAKNEFDVDNCVLTLAYLPLPPEGRKQSYGTIIELAWAHAKGKQTILVSDDPFVMAHPVVDVCAGWKLDTLDEAIDVIIGVLGVYA